MVTADAKAVAGIYNHYVTQTVVTFEEEAVSPLDMENRIHEVQSNTLPWFVAEREGEIVGYAYADKWKERGAYCFSTEAAVYVAADHMRQGIGALLYGRLLPALKDCGIHTVMGGIALPNDASIALHEKFGFKKAGHFAEVGFKFDRWIDVGYWQLIL